MDEFVFHSANDIGSHQTAYAAVVCVQQVGYHGVVIEPHQPQRAVAAEGRQIEKVLLQQRIYPRGGIQSGGAAFLAIRG